MSVSDRVRALVAPICTDLGLEIYDVEHGPGKVRVTVDKAGGVDLEELAVATRLISRELDERDPIPGRYQLEVSSPGLERTLRTPEHFKRAIGQRVSLRLHPTAGDVRRISGTLTHADDGAATIRLDPAVAAGRPAAAARPVDAARSDSDAEVGPIADSSPDDAGPAVAGQADSVRLPYRDIERARTTFAWGGQPKPGKGPRAVRTPATPEAEETV